MGFLSGVFGGSNEGSSTTSTNLPDWFTAYGQDLFNAGRSRFLNAPYPGADPNQRVAATNPDLEASRTGVRNMQGAFNPAMNEASGMISSGAGMVDTGFGTVGQGTGMVNAGSGMVGEGAGMVGQAGNLFNQGDFNQFMSPYTSAVTDRIAQLGARNLGEKILPQLNANFISGGNFGSSQNTDFSLRAMRDANESILGEQAKAMETGFGQSMNAYQTAQQRQLAAGQAMGTLGAQSGQLGTAMGTLGTEQGALGAQKGALGTQQGALAQARQGMQLRDAAALEEVGKDQRNMAQRQMDVSHGDFTEARDWDRSMLQGAANIGQGYTPPSTSTTNTTQESGGNLGGLGQLLGGAAAVASAIPWRQGGRIERRRKGGVIRRFATGGYQPFYSSALPRGVDYDRLYQPYSSLPVSDDQAYQPVYRSASAGGGGFDATPRGDPTATNPATTQSLGDMARESYGIARDMIGVTPGWGQVAGTLAGTMIGPGAGMIGSWGDYARGISRGALNQDPVEAHLGSRSPSAREAGALAQAKAEQQYGIAPRGSFFGDLFGGLTDPVDKSGVPAGAREGYDAGGNYSGSMDKGAPGPGPDVSPSSREGSDTDTKRRGGRVKRAGALKRYREAA